jgi:glycosyltransferase involved in cell wall biosynthesis
MTHSIVLVCPWYGPDSAGGAEAQARQLARSVRAIGGQLQVWTSTGRDAFHPTATRHYPEGQGEWEGVPIRRFVPVPAGRLGPPPDRLADPALRTLPAFPHDELRLLGSLLGSDDLCATIVAERERHSFVFLPYAFATSFWGALLAGPRAWLIPCLHDEPYARYSTYRHLFRSVRGALANSQPEQDLIVSLYGLAPAQVPVVGEGIDLTPRGDGERFRRRHGLEGDLLLYLGRRDASKNIAMLLSYLREYWARRGRAPTLLLAGPGQLELPAGLAPIVRDLGFLSPDEKHDAYAAADIFCQPSLLESFSIVLMEAWLQGRPALVNGDCAVTSYHCRVSGGGLAPRGFAEFAASLDLLLAKPQLRERLGERGRRYVLTSCDWDRVARRFLAVLESTREAAVLVAEG